MIFDFAFKCFKCVLGRKRIVLIRSVQHATKRGGRCLGSLGRLSRSVGAMDILHKSIVRRRETRTFAIRQHNWLVFIRYIFAHYWAVAIPSYTVAKSM